MLTIPQLKALSADNTFIRLAAACLVAEAVSQRITDHVNRYRFPLFQNFIARFPLFATLCHEVERDGPLQPVIHPKDLYLCEDEEKCAAYFSLLDTAHREAGYVLPEPGYCPASMASHRQCQREHALLEYTEKLTGVPFTECHLELRDRALQLLHGIALQNPSTATAAQAGLPADQASLNQWLNAA